MSAVSARAVRLFDSPAMRSKRSGVVEATSVSPAASGRPAPAPWGGVISTLTSPSAEIPDVWIVEPRGISTPEAIWSVTSTSRAFGPSRTASTSPIRTPLIRTTDPAASPCASSNTTTTS